MHLRALVPGTLLLTALAAAQDTLPATCQEKVAPTRTRALPVAVQVDGTACAAKAAPVALAGDCAATCAANASAPVALPVALAFDDDDEVSPKKLSAALSELPAGLDLSAILQDLDLEGVGSIAIKLGENGEYEVLEGFDFTEGLVGLEIADLSLGLQDLELGELAGVDLGIESDQILAELAATSDERGYLGVQMSLEGGMNVTAVLPGSGAEKAGLQAGDRILSIDGKSTEGESITDYLQGLQAGQAVQVVYVRGDARRTAKVVLMTLAAVQGGPEEEIEETDEELVIEDVAISDGGLVRVEGGGASDFRVLRGKVRDTVLQQLDESKGKGTISIAVAGPDGKPQVIETREVDVDVGDGQGELTFGITVGGDDKSGVRILRAGETEWVGGAKPMRIQVHQGEGGAGQRVVIGGGHGEGKNVELHVEAQVEGAPSGGFFFSDEEHAQDGRHGKIVIKRVQDGDETVEEYEWTGDDHGDLPEHIRQLLHEHGGGAGGIVVHAPHADGERHVVKKKVVEDATARKQGVFVLRADGGGQEGRRMIRLAPPDVAHDVLFVTGDGDGRWVTRLDQDDDDEHEGDDDDGHEENVFRVRTGAGGAGHAVIELHGQAGDEDLHEEHVHRLHDVLLERLHEHGLDGAQIERIHRNVTRRLNDRAGNRLFLAPDVRRGVDFRPRMALRRGVERDQERHEDVIHGLHQEIEELHRRIGELERLVERLARGRGR